MKVSVIKSEDRGAANHGWLKSHHSFSFANYYNPRAINFGALRVLNDDIVAPGEGFGTHPHKDMEIISIPLSGVLEHKDSEGNSGQISAGQVQYMSAGTGIKHSEYNGSNTEEVNFLQLWIIPHTKGLTPLYQQLDYQASDLKNTFHTIVSPDGSNNSISIRQNAWLHLSSLDKNATLNYHFKGKNTGLYLFVLKGQLNVTGNTLNTRDAISIIDDKPVEITALNNTEFLSIEVTQTPNP